MALKSPKTSAKPIHSFKLQMYHQCTQALKPQLPDVANEQDVHCTIKVHVFKMRQDLINYCIRYWTHQWQCINHKYNSPISIEAIPTPSHVGTLLKIRALIWSKSHKGPSDCGLSTSFHLASPHMTKTVTELSLVNPFNNFLFLFKSNKIFTWGN